MLRSRLTARKARLSLLVILWTSGLSAQTCLVFSPTTITADRTALFNLTLYSPTGTVPVALQWTFQYASSSVSSLTVDDGPMLSVAGKTAICAGDGAAYNCLAVGLNTKTILNGIIAKVTAVLAPGAATAAIQITNPRAASAGGFDIPVVARIQPTTDPDLSPDCRVLTRRSTTGKR